METNGVISRVTEPTPWCAGMVVVPNRDGTVQIRVDFKILNESVFMKYFQYPRLITLWLNLQEPPYSARLTPTVGFGRFH